MKTKFIVAFFLTFSAIGFSQKQELKAATKALKSGDTKTAAEALKGAKALLGEADEKTKAQYEFLNAQVLSSSAGDSLEKLENAATAYDKVIEIEKAAKISKFTEGAKTKKQSLIESLAKGYNKDFEAKNFIGASEKAYLMYKMNKADTLNLYYSAANAVNGDNYDMALSRYNELMELNYTGIRTQYVATNVASGEVEAFASKNARDVSVKSKMYIKPDVVVSESRKPEIAKNIALIYVSQGKSDLALSALQEAKKENPEDTSLMQSEANIYYKSGDIAKYREIMEQIVVKDPENPELFYNLGVSASSLGDKDQAMSYYKKAIELNPDYADAQVNISNLLLEKGIKIVDEMNSLGSSAKDNKRYDVLRKEKEALYKSVVPYLEAALKTRPDDAAVIQTLMQIFYQLDDPKADIMKDKLKALEGGM